MTTVRFNEVPKFKNKFFNLFLRNYSASANFTLSFTFFIQFSDLNLVDWSPTNILAVALGATVYLWNAGTGTIEQLFELEGNDYVCSVAWIQQGPYLAVGTTSGNTELWDCSEMKRARIMNGHAARVGSLAWNHHILSSGCR